MNQGRAAAAAAAAVRCSTACKEGEDRTHSRSGRRASPEDAAA
jgi:hypothetical protein